MCKCKKNKRISSAKQGVSVRVDVDVTSIVKYVAFAGMVIVGIIFGAKCFATYIHSKQ